MDKKEVKKVSTVGTVKTEFVVRKKRYVKGDTYDAKDKGSFDYLVKTNKLEANDNR